MRMRVISQIIIKAKVVLSAEVVACVAGPQFYGGPATQATEAVS